MSLYGQFDCALPRDPRMVAAGPLGRLVYIEASLYCRENLTDGIIDRLILPFFAVDVPSKVRHLNRLADVGALEIIDVGWRIPLTVWRRWNPLKAEVDEHRRAEAERKAEYRAKRKSQPSPNGTHPDVPTGPSCPVPDKVGTRANSHSHSHSHSQSKKEESSSVLTVVDPTHAQDDDDEFELVLTRIVDARELEYRPRKPRAWRHATRKNLIIEDGHTIRRELDNGLDADHVALLVLGYGTEAARERTEQPWCTPDCECEGDGWIRTDQGFTPCPKRAS